MKSLISAALFAATLGFSAPVMAQAAADGVVGTGEEQYRMVIVYGDDEVPAAVGEEIVVVARLPEADRFRIPENLRFSDDPANESWAQRVERLEMIGDFGTLSCSTAGAGGFTGCTQELIRRAYGEKETAQSVRFGQLIAAARAERLSTIDAEAAAEQERVEQIEREYMQRLEAEREAELPDAAAPEGSLVVPPQG
ncbi:hypothetical protein G7A66_10425 [Altererythrobacter sp. SALINAS58]|uniref:hypothetical protein n=1 Tax=Alteripontixanthobacter muriae TaxID=2705546 RepID=UPI0015775A13|nr:hypothetical protein [Alteripontixanthobacter muriae]NTZ43485.1 hypothetical protein [Alteripontixanthobacter muriae]